MRAGDLIDHYRLERDLGAGAFATVWLATDQYLDDPVAIKVLADNWARDDEVRRRFIDEAKIMRRIDHPRIVRVFTVGELPSGQPMFVMTYADRGTLAELIRDRRAQARRFSDDEVARLVVELTDCLTVVHDFGVVHRDLKPSNVLFRTPLRHESGAPDHGVMLLGDFGLAKDTIAHSGFTLAAGTPAYMPPEQARSTSELDHRADLYAATAIAFELLTGRPPFAASTLSDVQRSGSGRRARLDEHRSDLSPDWQSVIDVGLAADPAQRFASARDLADAVMAAAGTDRIAVPVAATSSVPAPGSLPGLRGRVDEILRGFGAEHSATIDVRLRGAPLVALVGEPGELTRVEPVAASRGLRTLQLAPGDVRVGEADALVLGAGVGAADVSEALADAPAGPVVVLAADDDELPRALSILERRSEAIRASAALAQLDDDVRRAGSAAMSESWMHVRDAVERLRLEVPALAELAALRSEVAGRLVLPASRRDALRRLLFEVDAADRLGLDTEAPDADLLAAATLQLAEWRTFQTSGRVPFTSRTAVETAVRCLERMWATLSGYTDG